MIRKVLFVALISASLFSCKSKSAFNYSEQIVAKERSLTPDITATEQMVKEYITNDKYDSVASAGARMEKLVQQKIDEIDKLPVPKAKEADNFKAATMRYFKFIKDIYTHYKDLGNAASEEERQTVLTDMQKMVDQKQDAINDMQQAQKKYADANGFKVE